VKTRGKQILDPEDRGVCSSETDGLYVVKPQKIVLLMITGEKTSKPVRFI
jgi:hypothetical protein